jgi:hypothetical protein
VQDQGDLYRARDRGTLASTGHSLKAQSEVAECAVTTPNNVKTVTLGRREVSHLRDRCRDGVLNARSRMIEKIDAGSFFSISPDRKDGRGKTTIMNWFLAFSVSAHLLWSHSDAVRRNGIALGSGIVDKAEVPGKGTILLGYKPTGDGFDYSLRFGTSDQETMFSLKGCPGPSSRRLENANPWWLRWLIPSASPDRQPNLSKVAAAQGGALWLAGSTNYYLGIASDPNSDAYIAKVDSTGRVLFEKAFGEGLYGPGIGTITVLPSGEVVATGGQVYGPLWIAKLTPQGDVEWLHSFPRKDEPLSSRDGGRPSGVALKSIASGPNGELIAAGFKKIDRAGADVATFWVLNPKGEPINEIQVGNPVSNFNTPHDEGAKIEVTADSFYVLFSHELATDKVLPQPALLTRVDMTGKLLSVKEIQNPIVTNTRFVETIPAFFVLPNSKIIVAWQIDAKIKLFLLDTQTGDVADSETSVPSCQGDLPMHLFFGEDQAGEVFLCGSPRGAAVEGKPLCVWLESISVAQ